MLLNCTALNASAIDNTALNALSALQSRNATDSSTQLLPPLLPLLLHTNQHCIPTRYNKIKSTISQEYQNANALNMLGPGIKEKKEFLINGDANCIQKKETQLSCVW